MGCPLRSRAPQLRAARELADKIKKGKVGAEGFFSRRDVYLNGWSGLDSPEAVKLAAEVFQDAGWVIPRFAANLPTLWAAGARPISTESIRRWRNEHAGTPPGARSRWMDWMPSARIFGRFG